MSVGVVTPLMVGQVSVGVVTPLMVGQVNVGVVTPLMGGQVSVGVVTPLMVGQVSVGVVTPLIVGIGECWSSDTTDDGIIFCLFVCDSCVAPMFSFKINKRVLGVT